MVKTNQSAKSREEHLSIHEVPRRTAKNSRSYKEFPYVNGRISGILLSQIAALKNVNVP